jgi:hypothetical protein
MMTPQAAPEHPTPQADHEAQNESGNFSEDEAQAEEELAERDESLDLIADIARFFGCDREWSNLHDHHECVRDAVSHSTPEVSIGKARDPPTITLSREDAYALTDACTAYLGGTDGVKHRMPLAKLRDKLTEAQGGESL